MANISPVPNSRKLRRARVLKAGKIIAFDFYRTIDVVIRDMSGGGAKVRTPVNVDLPGSFDLFIESEGLLYPAVTRWKRGEWIGIEFVGDPRQTPLHKH